MKNFVSLVLIIGSFVGGQISASAQTPAMAPTKTTVPAQTVVPATAPDATQNFVGKKFDGWIIAQKYWTNTPEAIWLGGLQDHVTVIEFFRINCPHCQEAAPSREALYLKYRARGLKMVGFHSPGIIEDASDPENIWSDVKDTIKQWKLNYPIAFDKDRAFFDKNNFHYYPTVLVLDKKGIVRFQQTGYSPEKARELDQFVGGMLSSK